MGPDTGILDRFATPTRICSTRSRERSLTLVGLPVHTEELSRKILRIGKEAHVIHVSSIGEVEPSARKAADATDSEARHPAELTRPR